MTDGAKPEEKPSPLLDTLKRIADSLEQIAAQLERWDCRGSLDVRVEQHKGY